MENVKKYTFEDENNEGVSLKCLHCGSPLVFDPDKQLFNCEVCKSEFKREELKIEAATKQDEEFDAQIKEYDCPSCGAEIVTDNNTTTEFCAYCGNPVILRGRVNGVLRPDLIIPFKISKKKAMSIIVKELKKYSFIPNSFFKESNLEKISGIYYPFWESDIDAYCKIQARCTKVSTWTTGDKRYTKTSYYDVYRDGDIHFEDISVNALRSVDKTLVEGVLPYPIADHIPFDIVYLSGFYAKKNDLLYDEVKPEVDAKLNKYSKTVLLNTISSSYSTTNVVHSDVDVKKLHKDYTLLPIWILNYKYGSKDYTFAINGVTGKVFGDIPISKVKLFFLSFGICAAIFLLVLLLGGFIL